VAFLSGCGAPTPDASTELGKRQLIDQANKALTTSDCSTALQILLPIYQSANTDNEVRLLTASAYACWANVNYFKLIGDIVSNSGTLAGSGFWSFASSLFPSTAGQDHVAEGAVLAQDALLASLVPGIPILPSGAINYGSYNVGSIYPSDRTDDSNLYLIFTAMAGIGSFQNRYGNPDSAFHPQSALPWKTAANATTDGCGYASSILNFVDAITQAQTIVPSNLKNALNSISSAFSTSLDLACDFGCTGLVPPAVAPFNPSNKWVASGCNFNSGCTIDRKCPSTLRNRFSCQAQTTDVNSCAAAGITNFINASSLGWQ
jgi:hypothetical protein